MAVSCEQMQSASTVMLVVGRLRRLLLSSSWGSFSEWAQREPGWVQMGQPEGCWPAPRHPMPSLPSARRWMSRWVQTSQSDRRDVPLRRWTLCTGHPKPQTVVEFWRIVWNKNSESQWDTTYIHRAREREREREPLPTTSPKIYSSKLTFCQLQSLVFFISYWTTCFVLSLYRITVKKDYHSGDVTSPLICGRKARMCQNNAGVQNYTKWVTSRLSIQRVPGHRLPTATLPGKF